MCACVRTFVRGFMFLMFYMSYRVLSGMQTRIAVFTPACLCLGACLLHLFLYVCVYAVRVFVCCTCVCMLYVCVRALHTCVCVCVRVFAVRVLEFSAHLHRCMSNAWIDLSPMPGVIP